MQLLHPGTSKQRNGSYSFSEAKIAAPFSFIHGMPTGLVCQLHYQGGGSLLYQDTSGESLQVPFIKAPYLRIGQRVFFSLNQSSGRSEAVDIKIISADEGDGKISFTAKERWKNQGRVGSCHPNSAIDIQHGTVLAAGPASSKVADVQPQSIPTFDEMLDHSVSFQSKKLQCSIGRFRNANLEERLAMIKSAEDLLHHLLNQAVLDGDAICKVVRNCAGWLHVPISFDKRNMGIRDEQFTSCSIELQSRVRRLLISALSHLDLTDTTTYHAVEAALTFLSKMVLQHQNSFSSSRGSTTSLALTQWKELKALVFQLQETEMKQKTKDVKVTSTGQKRMLGPDRASASEGIYRPNARVRSLTRVFTLEKHIQLLSQTSTPFGYDFWVYAV